MSASSASFKLHLMVWMLLNACNTLVFVVTSLEVVSATRSITYLNLLCSDSVVGYLVNFNYQCIWLLPKCCNSIGVLLILPLICIAGFWEWRWTANKSEVSLLQVEFCLSVAWYLAKQPLYTGAVDWLTKSTLSHLVKSGVATDWHQQIRVTTCQCNETPFCLSCWHLLILPIVFQLSNPVIHSSLSSSVLSDKSAFFYLNVALWVESLGISVALCVEPMYCSELIESRSWFWNLCVITIYWVYM